MACAPNPVEVGLTTHCVAVVAGQGGAPIGEVYFKSTEAGMFSASTCGLVDEGNGSASCGVDYTPEVPGAHRIDAYYSGDHDPTDDHFFLDAF